MVVPALTVVRFMAGVHIFNAPMRVFWFSLRFYLMVFMYTMNTDTYTEYKKGRSGHSTVTLEPNLSTA